MPGSHRPPLIPLVGLLCVGCGFLFDKNDEDDDDDDDGAGLSLEGAPGEGGADSGASESDSADTDLDDSGEDECGGTAPVVQEVLCENNGLQDHFETGEPTPTIKITVDVTDEDADLHTYTMKLFYDDVVNGSMDTSEDVFGSSPETLTSDECTAAEASIGMTVYIADGSMNNGALYEWGAIISDAIGLESELATTSCYIPNEDGSDGTGGSPDTGM